jgi:hypothetical protein
MVILTSTVSNNSIFTFNKAYADSLGSIRCCIDSSGNVFLQTVIMTVFKNLQILVLSLESGVHDVTGASPLDQKLTALTGFASPFWIKSSE